MHPAHTMLQGHARFAAGSSANFVAGNAQSAIAQARGVPPLNVPDRPSAQYIPGAIAVAAFAPGVAPFVAGRVGVGYGAEAGLAYTGRTARLDGRWALQDERFAGSIGVGGSAILSHRDRTTSGELANLQLDGLSGYGFDVPVLFGWRSSADAVWWWAGARGGYEALRGSLGYVVPAIAAGQETTVAGDIQGHRVYASGLMGFAFGFRHVHAAVEVQGGYQTASATLWGVDVNLKGLTVSPAAALLGSF